MEKIVDWVNSFSMGGHLSLLWFFMILGILLYLSMKLEKYSTGLAMKTKLGGAFIGGTLIALITSAPELVTEIVQAAHGTPEHGFADDLGSNFFSIFMMAVVAIVFVKKAKYLNDATKMTKYSMYYSALATGIAFIGSLANVDVVIGKEGTFAFGLFPALLFIGFITMLVVQYFVDEDEAEHEDIYHLETVSKNKIILMFIFIALLVVGASFMLNVFVSSLSGAYDINPESVGGLFLAITTSLPEVVIFLLFIKRGMYTLGITAITGSHAFNLGITFIGDMIYNNGPSFARDEMGDMWILACVTFVAALLLSIHLIFSKKLAKTKYYLCIPTLISITYIVGWIVMWTV